jgi:hypothetical protein
MLIRDIPRGFQVSPDLMLLTVRQLAKDNAELFEEVKQLRAAVNVYRELAMRKGPIEETGSSIGGARTAKSGLSDPRRHGAA